MKRLTFFIVALLFSSVSYSQIINHPYTPAPCIGSNTLITSGLASFIASGGATWCSDCYQVDLATTTDDVYPWVEITTLDRATQATRYLIGPACTPGEGLPVELSFFGVEASGSGILAKWTTESETENLGFTLDRRVEGTEAWNELATYQTNDALLGQGSTPSATDYEYLDALVEASTTYEYRLADVDYGNVVTYHATRTVTVASTPSTREVPDEFTVKEAYPNPFNPSTTIEYSIPVIASGAPQTGQAQQSQVQLQIYDITGKLVNTLVNSQQSSGWHSVQWNGRNTHNSQVPAGAYLIRVSSGAEVRHTKVLLLK